MNDAGWLHTYKPMPPHLLRHQGVIKRKRNKNISKISYSLNQTTLHCLNFVSDTCVFVSWPVCVPPAEAHGNRAVGLVLGFRKHKRSVKANRGVITPRCLQNESQTAHICSDSITHSGFPSALGLTANYPNNIAPSAQNATHMRLIGILKQAVDSDNAVRSEQ